MAHNFVNPVEITDSTDTTKKINFDPSGATTDTSATISTEQVADRNYSVPDSGADAEFLMSEGAQTINGTKTFNGSLLIKESSGSDTITIQAPALATSYSLTLPVDDGTSNNQVLTTDGNGVLSWQSMLPAGIVLPAAGSSAPSGFLLCDGSAVSQVTYPNLFAYIGSTWDTFNGQAAPGAGLFRVPKLNGMAMIGAGAAQVGTVSTSLRTLGDVTGSETRTLTTTELPSHNHTSGTLANSTSAVTGSTNSVTTGVTTGTSGSTHTHTMKFSNGGAGIGVEDTNDAGGSFTTGTPTSGTAEGAHTHNISDPGHSHSITGTAAAQTISGSTGSTGTGAAFNIMQPSAVLTFIIKY